MDRYYSFLLSSFCGVYLRSGDVGGGVCGASLGLRVKPAKNIYIEGISRVFSSKLRQILIIFISVHCKTFVLKICQTVDGITMMRQYPEFFFKLIFGGFFPIWPNCAPEEKNDLTYAANEDFHYLYLTSMYVL